ncbi:MAG: DUF4249 domain-containing protein [Taibaiella sp.]|jgi:hypothetical protein
MNKNKSMLKTFSSLMVVAVASIVCFTSCQKVIDVKLDEADKKIVIDAVITDHEGGCMVKLSKTKNFNDNNDFIGLGGAVVTIKDETGNTTTLTETTSGVYTNNQLKGASGKTYQLLVTVEGKSYSASSTMPENVHLDSLYLKTQKFFDEEETFSNVVFQDPGGVQNYYLFKQFVNGKRTDGTFIMDDDLSDGKQFKSTLYLFADDEDKIKSGDIVEVEMQCIDKAAYKYWYSYDQAASGGGSATPANPVSNISGGALGSFSAQTVQRKSVIAP